MNATPTQQSALEEPHALIIALQSRRFVIVRADQTEKLYPADPICKRIRDLQPGDEVYYEGRRDTVRSLCPY